MATLKASSLFLNSSISSSSFNSKQRGLIIRATINIPNRVNDISLPGLQTRGLMAEELQDQLHKCTDKPLSPVYVETIARNERNGPDSLVVAKLYAILEAVADRVEMHKNIGDQRTNWNSLL
ncbi:UNVERIFIED_CONTAM: putative F-box protein [Sesamum radiatum]|uniref:F-box protein n=1 Tax=Sesamum radiatum TaxID=300843 RepID=A0AAW2LPB7_SESRA